MNLLDITLVAETVLPSNISAIQCLMESSIETEALEVLTVIDLSIIQKEVTSGNNVLILRSCMEYPAKMIKAELEEYSNKAAKRLQQTLEELLSSENNLFSIKSCVTKFL